MKLSTISWSCVAWSADSGGKERERSPERMRRITSSDRGNVHKGGSSLGSVDLVMVGGWKWERDF